MLASAFLLATPCVSFGILYGQSVSRVARRWGRDVGRFSFINTAGCCLGILAVTSIGLEISTDFLAWLIALAYLGLLVLLARRLSGNGLPWKAALLAGLALFLIGIHFFR